MRIPPGDLTGRRLSASSYKHGPGIDEPLAMGRFGAGGGTVIFHADGLGSISTLTDLNGNPVRTYTYDSFGRIVAQTGTFTNSYTYTGRELDPESGLYYYRARYYDPTTGTFIQQDPMGLAGLLNPYAYVNNSPVSLIDPLGLYAIAVPAIYVAAVEAAKALAFVGSAVIVALGIHHLAQEANEPQEVPAPVEVSTPATPPPPEDPCPRPGAGAIPKVQNRKLQNLVNDFYSGVRNPNRVGTGTTADAVRHETLTGQPVGGRWHFQKAADLARGFENWLRRNPNAAPHPTEPLHGKS